MDCVTRLFFQGMTVQVIKTDAKRQQVFGWASIAMNADGERTVDAYGDIIEPEDLEDAAYEFVLRFRDLNEKHEGPVQGKLIESLVVTPEKLEKMGLASEAMAMGWWVGFWVPDPIVFAKIESGEYAMFSIEGTALRGPA
jgi:hypothetical protein